MSLIESAGPILIRASCLLCAGLAMVTTLVLADLWRIERRQGRLISAVAVAALATSVLLLAVVFGKCALTGCYPQTPTADCPPG